MRTQPLTRLEARSPERYGLEDVCQHALGISGMDWHQSTAAQMQVGWLKANSCPRHSSYT